TRPDLVVLDLMLPDRDGWDVTRELRSDERVAGVPIIMLTARVEDSDKLVGLEHGADDYVTKPFNPRELVARVRAVLRRGAGVARVAECFRSGDLSLDVSRHEVRCGGKMIDVTPTEFRLLETMLQAPGCAFTRTELIERALGYDYEGLERTLDSHIKNLRRKVEPDPRRPKYIHTVYGVGYRVEAPDNRRGTEA
ncbi:MAG: winged helix-turn-helix domain-containing protein, partial [Anaerolineae bacterium]